jgi:choline-sulfatase
MYGSATLNALRLPSTSEPAPCQKPPMKCSKLLILSLALAPELDPNREVPHKTTERPNFLFIIADDQSPFDLRAYDPDSPLETPHIDSLVASGMTLDGAYHMGSWSGAVCTPSRHMVMSGRTLWHLPRNGKRGVEQNPLCPSDLEKNTLAAVFNRAGYDTMRTCKKGNSYAAANRQFTVLKEATKRKASAEEGSAWHAQQVLDYLDQRVADEDEDPFFIYFGFSHPHDPRWASAELLEKYGADNETIPDKPNPKSPPLPKNYLPIHPFHHGHPGLRDEVNVQGVKLRRDPPTIRNELGRQFACGENIDIQIGRVLERLEAMGVLANTYVIYTADHGMAIGRHGLQGKQNLYEHTLRVPMIVKGPGIPAGKRAQGNVYLLDLLATVCDLASIEAPETSEGITFAPVLKGKLKTIREVIYGAYCGGTKPGMRSIRWHNWKLIKYDCLDGFVRETQLFDLSKNPLELLPEHQNDAVVQLTGHRPSANETNLANDPRFASYRAQLENVLLAEMERLGDPYRLWDQE